MSYYRGDYYRGDYYRGDPGILSGIGKFIGGAVKTVAGVARGFATGGPIGAVVGGARAIGTQLIQRHLQAPVLMAAPSARVPQMIAPTFGGQIQTGGLFGGVQVQSFGGRPGGGSAGSFRVDPRTGELVKKRRRMNVTNVKALRRAIRRSRGFIKIARKTVGAFGLSVQRRGAKKIARRR